MRSRCSAVVLFGLVGCVVSATEKYKTSTGLDVTVVFEASAGIDALRVSATDAGAAVHDPTTVPDKKAGPLASPTETVVLLPDALVAHALLVRVDGLAGDALVLSGIATVTIAQGALTPVSMTLGTPPVCGDGQLAAGFEACDDGNTTSGDGCSSSCEKEVVAGCGDGIIQAAEGCDDGSLVPLDGCSATCTVEAGWSCAGTPSVCARLCGNKKLDTGETCDDGNRTAGDGCDASCAKEALYECLTPGALCTLLCGNGRLDSGETCDDALASAPGCDANCQLEGGYECLVVGQPCTPLCGNGRLDGSETCDPGGGPIGPTFSQVGGSAARHNCLSEGFLGSADKLACTAACALDATGCGVPIDTVARINLALADAFDNAKNPGHDVISIRDCVTGLGPCPYAPAASIQINEVGTAHGVTLRPLSGIVQFSGAGLSANNWVFMVLSGNNRLAGLEFFPAPLAVQFASADATGGNTFASCLLSAPSGGAQFVDVQSVGNKIIGNEFLVAGTGPYAIKIESGAANTAIIENVISGSYTYAVEVGLTSAGETLLDQNTLSISGAGKYGVRINTNQAVCARNNAIVGDGTSFGYRGDQLASVACGASGPSSGHNAVLNVTVACAGGAPCSAATCQDVSGGPLCDVLVGYQATAPPTLDANYCPGPPLVGAGLALGYSTDLTPDLGARQSGATSVFGNTTMPACP